VKQTILCRTRGISLLAVAAALPVPLAAQDNDDSILVTAEREQVLISEAPTGSRLGLSILETPATVSVVTGEDLRARGDMSIIEAASRAPGVTNDANPGNAGLSFAMRGFSGQGSVLQLYDGVRLMPNNGSISFPTDPWNVERIEVVSGPASVLFGQGAMGGVVNVIPRSPNQERTEIDAEIGYGTDNTFHVGTGMGGPVNDVLSVRGDFSYRRSDGYVDRGDSDSISLSGAIMLTPSDTFSVTLRNDFGLVNPMQYFGTPLIDGELDTSIREENYNVADATMRFRDNRTALKLDWEASDSVTLSNTAYYLTSARKWRNLETYAYSAPGLIYRADNYGIVHDVEQYGSQGFVSFESGLGGEMSNTLLVGYDLNRFTLNYSHQFASDYQEDVVPQTGFDPGLFLDTVGLLPRYHTRTTTWAIYAEDRLAITEQFSLVGGIRHEENKTGRWNWVYTNGVITGDRPALGGGTEPYKKLDSTTWRVGAVYQPNENLSFYGQYATAVDPLGSLTTFGTTVTDFQLTYANGYQYEAGVKGLFMGGRGSFTLAAYRLVKQNLLSQVVSGGAIEQVGQRSSQGIEASLDLELGAGFGFSANGTVLDANFDDFNTSTDNTPPGVPEQSANAELRWSDGSSFSARANVRHVGRRFTDNANDFRVPAYTVVDLGASYALMQNVSLDVRVYNLFDKDYAFSTYANEQWILGRPQSFDVSVRAAF